MLCVPPADWLASKSRAGEDFLHIPTCPLAQQEGDDIAIFYKLTWGKIALMILAIVPPLPIPPGVNENFI